MFRTYDKIRRYGDDDVQGIDKGECSIFPKIDGTCSIVYMEDGLLRCASRKCELSESSTNQHFYDFVMKRSAGLISLIRMFETGGFGRVTLYGEWLVPHTIRTYDGTAWFHWYIFDVFSRTLGRYLTYDGYTELIEIYN